MPAGFFISVTHQKCRCTGSGFLRARHVMEGPRGRLTTRGPSVPSSQPSGADLREAPPYYLMLRRFFRSPTVRTLGAFDKTVVTVMRDVSSTARVASPGPSFGDRRVGALFSYSTFVPSDATTESLFVTEGNPKNEIARFKTLRSRILAISNTPPA
jgi:hypothetical protein